MRKDITGYFKTLKGLFDEIVSTDSDGKSYELDQAIDKAIRMIVEQASCGGKVMFIGNGASASISSHMATDFWKNAGIRALSFNDSALLTCISNDYGYEHVFEKPIEAFAEPNDCLIAISSSGKSKNILLGAGTARKKGIKVITLSGFDRDNPLRKLGDINFYVPEKEYGYVETVHHCLCHCLVDIIIKHRIRLMDKAKTL